MMLSMKGRASRIFAFWLLLVLFVLVACGEQQAPEEQVREFISNAKRAVEERDVIALDKLISDRYTDSGRRNRRALVGLTAGYFLRHKNIYLYTQIKDITFSAKEQARVNLYVAMAGTPVTGAQALIDLRADLFQFDLTLTNVDGDWRLLNASWQRASMDDLLGGES